MPWFVVDDSAHTHPKIVKAGNAAVGLWMRCGSYAAQHLTDGIVPAAIASMYGTGPQAAKLVKLGLWHPAGHICAGCPQPAEGDYVMHDYLAYNPNRKQVLDRRARAAEKKRKQRGESAPGPQNPSGNHARNGFDSSANRARIENESSPIHNPVFDDFAGQEVVSRGDSHETHARAFPSPPLPSQLPMADVGGVGTGGGALSDWPEGPPAPIDVDGFTVTDSMRRWANEVYPHINLQHSTQQFIRHYRSTGTRRKNWPEAWRKWIAEDAERAGRHHLPAAAGAENVLHLPAARRPSITDQRVAEGMALADRLAAEEGTRP